MKLRVRVLAGAGCLMTAVTGVAIGGSGAVPAAASLAVPPACADPVATWSLPALVNELLMVEAQFAALGTSGPEAAAGVGGLVLFGQPPAGAGPSIASGLAALNADAAAAGAIHPWYSTDEEGGTVTRLAQVVGPLPSARRMAAQWNTAQVESATARQGAAMRSLGLTMDLAPVLDTASPTDTVAAENTRSFSEDGNVAAAYGLAFADGLLSAGVVPVVKHFPGLGHANADTDTGPATDPPLSSLEQDDLIPFAQAAHAGLPVVMVGHPSVPGLTNGAPASLSAAAYRYLRQTLGFTGVAMTDALGAGAIADAGYSEPAAAVQAIESGADMAMIDASQWQPTVSALEAAVNGGSLPMAQLQASVGRILAAKRVGVCPVIGMAATRAGTGYWVASSGGGVQPFGSAAADGSMTGQHLNEPIVGMAAMPTGNGYWEVASDGGIFTFGTARFWGSMGGQHLNEPIVDMAAMPTGNGYWEVASDGGIFTFGTARFWGSMGGQHLNEPIVGMAAMPTGNGYWEVASDGGIFTFGTARFWGSMGGQHLNEPIVGMAAMPTGNGYWEVASDGGIFTFGTARFWGSMGGQHLNEPIVGMAAMPTGNGYWEVASDGGIFTFGTARFWGSGA